MVTNEDRRRVAERLRSSIPEDGVMGRGNSGWSLLYRTIFGHYMHNQSSGKTYSEVAGRLAELIEPAPTSSDTAPTCDRDALLALADAMERKADDFDATVGDVPMVHAGYLTAYAGRIRGLCGEPEAKPGRAVNLRT